MQWQKTILDTDRWNSFRGWRYSSGPWQYSDQEWQTPPSECEALLSWTEAKIKEVSTQDTASTQIIPLGKRVAKCSEDFTEEIVPIQFNWRNNLLDDHFPVEMYTITSQKKGKVKNYSIQKLTLNQISADNSMSNGIVE